MVHGRAKRTVQDMCKPSGICARLGYAIALEIKHPFRFPEDLQRMRGPRYVEIYHGGISHPTFSHPGFSDRIVSADASHSHDVHD